MARVKRGVTTHAKHKKIIKQAKGFRGRRKNTFKEIGRAHVRTPVTSLSRMPSSA